MSRRVRKIQQAASLSGLSPDEVQVEQSRQEVAQTDFRKKREILRHRRIGMHEDDFVDLSECEEDFCLLIASGVHINEAFARSHRVLTPHVYSAAMKSEDPRSEFALQGDLSTYEVMHQTDIQRCAYQLSQTADVRSRLSAMEGWAAKQLNVTVETLTSRLDTAYQMAQANNDPGAMIKATMGAAKLHGLETDKRVNNRAATTDFPPALRNHLITRARDRLTAIEVQAEEVERDDDT